MGKKTATCYILNGDEVLLQKKAKGLFGENLWNAPGGKVNIGEQPKQGAIREVYEETQIHVEDLKMAGKIYFYVDKRLDQTLYVYRTAKFSGEGKNSREGQIKWFRVNSIPFDRMWADSRQWLPLLLNGKRFSGKFYYSSDYKSLLGGDVQVKNGS